MTEHAIKIKEKYFKAVLSGEKTFEIRKNDRDYKVGDIIRFVPIDDECGMIIPHNPNTYKITYVFYGGEYGLEEGYCVFGIAKDDFFNFDSPVVRVDEKSYNKAIDDVLEKALEWNKNSSKKVPYAFIHFIAEELKGVQNE